MTSVDSGTKTETVLRCNTAFNARLSYTCDVYLLTRPINGKGVIKEGVPVLVSGEPTE